MKTSTSIFTWLIISLINISFPYSCNVFAISNDTKRKFTRLKKYCIKRRNAKSSGLDERYPVSSPNDTSIIDFRIYINKQLANMKMLTALKRNALSNNDKLRIIKENAIVRDPYLVTKPDITLGGLMDNWSFVFLTQFQDS